MTPSTTFRCEKYACSMPARDCILRQGARYLGHGTWKKIAGRIPFGLEFCAGGSCEQGKLIKLKLGNQEIKPARDQDFKAMWVARRKKTAARVPPLKVIPIPEAEKKTRKRPVLPVTACARQECGKMFVPARYETRFCSKSCGLLVAKARTRADLIAALILMNRRCDRCGDQILPTLNNRGHVDARMFRRRRFCAESCRGVFRQERLALWRAGRGMVSHARSAKNGNAAAKAQGAGRP